LPRSVLITGSEGYVGSSLIPYLTDLEVVTLDRRPASNAHGRLFHVTRDLGREPDAVREALDGAPRFDALVHLAANPHASARWDDLYEDNVLATMHAYELARELGMGTIAFASSVHVVNGYRDRPETWPVGPEELPWPTNAYGISKLAGESFLQMQCDSTPGSRGFALRIGSYWDGRGPLHTYEGADVLILHAEDFADIVRWCLGNRGPEGFHRVFCTSRIPRPVLDIEETRRVLGYEPRHDAATYFPPISPRA
jgi:nucleoside-diphosphate-sugar epimerase